MIKMKRYLGKTFKRIITDHVCWRDINGKIHNIGFIDEADIKSIVAKLIYEVERKSELSVKQKQNIKKLAEASCSIGKTKEYAEKLIKSRRR